MSSRIAKSPPAGLFKFAADAWTKPFWDAARAHRLTACRCGACGRFRMPPTPFCPNCRSQSVEWPTLSGQGSIFTYTVVERAIAPGMEESIPYVPAVIELPDAPGVRLVSNIVGCLISELKIGAVVRAFWEDRDDEVSVVRFKLNG